MSTAIDIKTPRGKNICTSSFELSVSHHESCIKMTSNAPTQPMQISIRLSDERAGVPVICNIPEEKPVVSRPLAMFPFLPLPPRFEPSDTYQWQQLVTQIEQCLVADPLLNFIHPEYYRLMRELFWMAFVAAYPGFPHGDWPRWNGHIAMEGDFISHWLWKDECNELPDTFLMARFVVWKQFRSIISDMSIFSTQ